MKDSRYTISRFPAGLRSIWRIVLLLSFFTIPFSAFNALNAQEAVQDALYIYRNDGGFNAFFYADIDRFEYSRIDTLGVEHSDYVVQEVYALDTLYRIPLSAIDSVTFVTPKTVYKKDVAHTTESDLWNYVIGSDTATVLVLAANTPQSMIPKQGDKIVTTKSRDHLPIGFYGRVTSVERGSQGITVKCNTPELTELFDQWVCKAAARSEDPNAPSRRNILGSENAVGVTLPVYSFSKSLDLKNLSYQLNSNWSLTGSGSLSYGMRDVLTVRVFLAIRPILGINFDNVMRMEKTTWFDLDIKGGVSGTFDIKAAATWTPIPNTPFAVETEAGISVTGSGETELRIHRKNVTSDYSMVQYNNCYYDEERQSAITSTHLVKNEAETSLTGTASFTVGPYFQSCLSLGKKEIGAVGTRYDAGLKATVSAELKLTDYLLAAMPQLLPAYMISNPTALYDLLNRDGSVTFGPFCTGKLWVNIGPWKKEAEMFEVTTPWKIEGGLVPEFKNTSLKFDEQMKPTATVNIRRPALLYPPVGFAAYYTKSGKRLGEPKWKTDMYRESELKKYSMELPKFGGGKEVRVFPTVKVLRLYELLGSPFVTYTVPAEMKVEPELLEFDGAAGEASTTVTDNLDRNEDNYETTVAIDFGEGVKPWFTGKWVGNDYVIKTTQNDAMEPRSADITFTTCNKDQSIRLEKKSMVVQGPSKEGEASVNPLVVEFPAEGGAKFVKYDFGNFEYVSAGFHPYPTVGGVKANWSEDYLSGNRYPNEMYITAPPNETGKETIDTLGFYFTNDKSIPNKDRYAIEVVIKRAPGPFAIQNLAKHFIGSWLSWENGATWQRRLVFNADGSYTRYDRYRDGTDKEWKKWNESQGTYAIQGWQTGSMFMRLSMYLSLESNPNNEFIELYPHFMRSGAFYFEREE